MSTTIDLEDPDFLLARQLQDQYDRELVELSSGEDDDLLLLSGSEEREPVHHIELSDNEDEVFLVARIPGETVTDSKPPRIKEEDEAENSQFECSYRAKRTDLNGDEYFIEELQTYVDPENNFEWKFVETMPDIKAIFLRLDELFFLGRFKTKRFAVIWSRTIGKDCTSRNFNDADGRYTVALNEVLLNLRPRIEIISVLLHEMIHAYLKLEGVKEPNGGHGSNFRKIMVFLNRMLQTNISFSHRLTNIDTLCRTQWYRCTGICGNYKPFNGIVRSTEGPPGIQNEWWKTHAEDCGGTFYKIYEMSKVVDDEVSTRYAVNVKYMKPKRENIRGRLKITQAAKESIDLTSGKPRIIPSLTETISLDDDANVGSAEETKAADKFIQSFNRTVALSQDTYAMQCPICQERVKKKLFGNHIDGCIGIVQRVSWKRRAGQVVQNGILENRVGLHVQESQPPVPAPVAGRRLGSSSSIDAYQQIKRQRFF
ncbi:uncharacterized protein LOC129733100 [Wyeomyia smithii]|uniref:uncharacterized protein LOC129733100 n=1 Tax=Wyeomyia smithii TaxID=174621 RepID=UPI002467D791|nr:uncharacterized protein LOC129733100 [Wyeomyia smithii]